MLSSMKMLGRRATPEERYSNQDTLASKLGHRGAWRAPEDGLLLGAVLRFLPCRVDVDPVPCDEGREGVVAAHGRSWLARSWRETMPRFQPGVEGGLEDRAVEELHREPAQHGREVAEAREGGGRRAQPEPAAGEYAVDLAHGPAPARVHRLDREGLAEARRERRPVGAEGPAH